MNRRITMTTVLLLIIVAVKVVYGAPRTTRDFVDSDVEMPFPSVRMMKRYGWLHKFQNHHEAGIHFPTGTDRFRFLHMGLGKRIPAPLPAPQATQSHTHNGKADHVRVVNAIKTLLNNLQMYNDVGPYTQYYHLATHPKFFLQRMKLFRTLQDINNLNNKRAPEEFSESQYPIQAGKQQLEVTLDSTINTADNILPYSSDLADEDSGLVETGKGNELWDESNVETQTETPYDLIFASPDLQVVYPQETVQSEAESLSGGGSETDHQDRGKRWWAARMLSQFRSPKSWTRRTTESHIDPALYFIGLGK